MATIVEFARAVPRLNLGQTAHRVATTGGVLQFLMVLCAAGYILAFLGAGILRATYPYTIDGVEPGALQEVRRILSGQPLYVAPELGYVPLIYGPVYFYAAAAVAAVSDSALFAMRMVSVLASLASIGIVGLLIHRETGSAASALIGAGLLAACSPLVDKAMDVGRMDALSLVFLLGSIYFARLAVLEQYASWQASLWSGLLMGMSILTKQTGVFVAVAIAVLFAVHHRRLLVTYVAGAMLVVLVGMGLLVAQSGMWPVFYLWQLPRGHEIRLELLPRFWGDLATRFTLPIVVAPFYLLVQALERNRAHLVFYAIAGAGLVGMAWLSDSSLGGGRNVELPAYAAFAILSGLAFHEALRLIGTATQQTRAIGGYVLCLAIAQFATLFYNPRLVVPYRSDMWAGHRLSATLAALPGPIFAGSFHSYLSDPRAVAPDLGAIAELSGAFGGGGTPEGAPNWEGEFASALEAKRFTYVIVDPDVTARIETDLLEDFGYRDAGPLFPPGDIYWSWRTGWSPRAEVYVPR